MPYGNGLLSSLHLDKYPMLNVSLWKLLSCNDQRNNHEINNKLLLGCSKLHLQWSHNWKHNCTFKSWWYERHNRPLDPLIIVHIIGNLIFNYIFNYVIIEGQVFWSLNILVWFCDLFHIILLIITTMGNPWKKNSPFHICTTCSLFLKSHIKSVDFTPSLIQTCEYR